MFNESVWMPSMSEMKTFVLCLKRFEIVQPPHMLFIGPQPLAQVLS